ncbi:MAG: hypothetical protein AB7I30_23800, partial [Isosphaeraceae bacterium]
EASRASTSEAGDALREGVAMTIVGRSMDQGILAKLVIDETRVPAVHKVKVGSHGTSPCREGEEDCDGGECETLSVPEVATGQLAGEWLIPKEGALLVSLGAYTVADKEGKAVVRERVLVLEARPIAPTVTTAGLIGQAPAPRPISRTITLAPVPAHGLLPRPSLPSRSLPLAVTADGKAIPLPPLPDLAPPTRMSGSETPCSSPQAGHVDTATAHTAFTESKSWVPASDPGGGSSATRRFTFSLPNGRVTLELRATTDPTATDSAPAPPVHP